MKRLQYIFLFLLPLGVCAQNVYEVAPFMQNGIGGTSRYISMGGSMGALGADVSVMGSNPAGIAVYRNNDFSITGSVGFNNTEATYNTNVVSSNNTTFNLENFAAVLAGKVNDGTSLKFVHLGIGYRKRNGLDGEFSMAGPALGYSQQYAIRDLYDNDPFELKGLNYTAFEGFRYSWLPLLATYANMGDIDGNLLTKPDGSLIFEPTDVKFESEEKGGVNELDFNFAANISDRLYLGATLSLVNIDYSANTYYYEYDDIGEIYSLGNYNTIKGSGYNIKLGAIFRPFKYSPFKVGVAVHTPTWYTIRNSSYADIWGPDDNDFYDTRDEDLYYDVLVTNSKFNSPWRFIASASYTFDTFMALNVDYEFADYTSANYKFLDAGSKDIQNELFKRNFNAQHILRVGTEINVGAGVSLRAGYNYSTAPFKVTAYKDMLDMPVTSTSTEFTNRYSKEAVALGAGYRGKMLYFDVAYVYDTQKADFYTYYLPGEMLPPAAKMNFTNHTITATLGMRF